LNLNADKVDGWDLGLTTGVGGIPYVSGSQGISMLGPPSPAGALLRSQGSGAAPTWFYMNVGDLLIGGASGVPTSTAMSGDATINSSGVLTIGANAVGTAEIIDGNVQYLDLGAGPRLGLRYGFSISFGSEVADTRRITIRVTDNGGTQINGSFLLAWHWASAFCTAPSAVAGMSVLYVNGWRWDAVSMHQQEWALTDGIGRLEFDATVTGAQSFYICVFMEQACQAALITFS